MNQAIKLDHHKAQPIFIIWTKPETSILNDCMTLAAYRAGISMFLHHFRCVKSCGIWQIIQLLRHLMIQTHLNKISTPVRGGECRSLSLTKLNFSAPWHCSTLQQLNIKSHPYWFLFDSKCLFWWWECDNACWHQIKKKPTHLRYTKLWFPGRLTGCPKSCNLENIPVFNIHYQIALIFITVQIIIMIFNLFL